MSIMKCIMLAATLFLAAAPAMAADQALKSQTTCPVMGGQINKDLYVDYQGKRIYVCCPNCLSDLKADPEKYLSKLAAMGQAPCPVPAPGTPVALAPGQPPARERTIGFFLFPYFEILDVTGPLEVWGNLKFLRSPVRVVTVAISKGEIVSSQETKLVADYGFDDCPPLDLIVVPGGIGSRKIQKDAAALEWLRGRAAKAEIVTSVCTGASVLAAAGLLDGRRATNNKMYLASAAFATDPYPKVQWVKSARWVDDGNIVTSSGVSAGIDMSLHVVERLYGKEMAEKLANLAEYEWHRDPDWDPFAKLYGLDKP